MEKFQSLADFLAVPNPREPSLPVQPVRTITRKQFCREVLDSKEYRESLLQRVLLGTLHPSIEVMLYHYADGKPVERVEVKDTTDPVEQFTTEQCEDRAKRLLSLAHRIRKADAANNAPLDDEGADDAPAEVTH